MSLSLCVCVCVVGEEQAKSQVSLASSNQLSLTVTETDLTNLTASIKRPSGQEEPCGLRRQPSGQLGKWLQSTRPLGKQYWHSDGRVISLHTCQHWEHLSQSHCTHVSTENTCHRVTAHMSALRTLVTESLHSDACQTHSQRRVYCCIHTTPCDTQYTHNTMWHIVYTQHHVIHTTPCDTLYTHNTMWHIVYTQHHVIHCIHTNHVTHCIHTTPCDTLYTHNTMWYTVYTQHNVIHCIHTNHVIHCIHTTPCDTCTNTSKALMCDVTVVCRHWCVMSLVWNLHHHHHHHHYAVVNVCCH